MSQETVIRDRRRTRVGGRVGNGFPAGAVCGMSRPPAGTGIQMRRSGLETAGDFEWGMKPQTPTACRRAKRADPPVQKRLDFQWGGLFHAEKPG